MIKKGLKVKILAGKNKNKEGEVIEVDRTNYRAKVKDLNTVSYTHLTLPTILRV